MIIQKINESFTVLIPENDIDVSNVRKMHDYLKAEKGDAKYNFKIKNGWESPYKFYTDIVKNKQLPMQIALKVSNGHLQLLESYGISKSQSKEIFGISEFNEAEIDKILQEATALMPFEPYDYQIKCAKDNLLNPKQISLCCTSSGKSAIMFLMLYFLYKNNKKGYLIVPNINLLEQLISDIRTYFVDQKLADAFLENIDTQGGGTNSTFDKFLTISTWQSLINRKDVLDKADFIICDELHRYASDVSSEIVEATINSKYKWGLTGTMPDDEGSKLVLIGLFGLPRRYISARELIDRGLATPVKINSIFLNYNISDKNDFNNLKRGDWQKQLTFIKEHELRNNFITNLAIKVKDSGNVLLLGTHTMHIKDLFTIIMKKIHPTVEVQNKDITGKKSFEFQKRYGVYFLNGEDDAKTRELTRKIIDEKHYVLKYGDTYDVISENETFEIQNENNETQVINCKDFLTYDIFNYKYKNKKIDVFYKRNEILVSNYQLLSTGVNIKALFNCILASPMKAYTTITQTIGRGLRLHPDKKLFNLYDIVDIFSYKGQTGVFFNQYVQRCSKSYNPEEFPIEEIIINF